MRFSDIFWGIVEDESFGDFVHDQTGRKVGAGKMYETTELGKPEGFLCFFLHNLDGIKEGISYLARNYVLFQGASMF